MSIRTFTLIWALLALTVTIVLAVGARWWGWRRTSGWLVLVGIVVVALEEPLLTWFWAVVGTRADVDGMAGLVTANAQAHVLDTATFATAWFALLGWIALTALRRGERWAVRVLGLGWLVTLSALVGTVVAVYPRGLAGPGYGWEQLAVGLLAWGIGVAYAGRD
jgi:hypothetical protein